MYGNVNRDKVIMIETRNNLPLFTMQMKKSYNELNHTILIMFHSILL